MEDQLNALHSEKMKNEELAKKEFEERVRDTKKKAIMENIEKAKAHGNVLTQTIDDEGNLNGVIENVDFESRDAASSESANLKDELAIDDDAKEE